MKRSATALVILLSVSSWAARQAHGGTIGILFNEPRLVDNDPVLQFYNGGTTSGGIGPGPNFGVSFGINARVRIGGTLVGNYTPPGFMQLSSDAVADGAGISTFMDVAGGLVTGLSFSYAAVNVTGRLRVYDGPDGTGNVLADLVLPNTSNPGPGPGVFRFFSVNFAGVGRSVVFDGPNKELYFDDFVIRTPVPEPPSRGLLGIGIGLLAACLRRKGISRRPRSSPGR